MTRSAEKFLAEEHERYMKQVSESGMPMWMVDYYIKTEAEWQEKEHLRNQLNDPQHEPDQKDTKPDDTGDDTHLFI